MTEKTDNETLLAEGDLVADYLEELLDIADLDGDIENSVNNGRAHVVIDTEDDRLVGKDGEVLDALQELSRLVVMTETGAPLPAHPGHRRLPGEASPRAGGPGQGRHRGGRRKRRTRADGANERL